MQCMVERRKGGETGVRSVQLVEGDAVWKAGEERRWSKVLLSAALSRSDTLRGVSEADDLRPQDLVHNGALPKLVKNPSAYFVEYKDGLKATMLMLHGAVSDFLFAAKLKGHQDPVSTQFFLSPTPNVTYSACLMGKAEEMFVTGKAPYPVERTMLVSGILDKCLDSRIMGHKRLETPELVAEYRAPKESHFGG
jgi:hypothetical protein